MVEPQSASAGLDQVARPGHRAGQAKLGVGRHVELPGARQRAVRPESKLAVVASVPPFKVRPPLAAPRLASRDTCRIPPVTVVPPR